MNSVMASAANAADKPCSIEGAICNFINKIAKAFRINHKVIFDYLFKSSYMPV